MSSLLGRVRHSLSRLTDWLRPLGLQVLAGPAAVAALKRLLLPTATVLTPNMPEARARTRCSHTTRAHAHACSQARTHACTQHTHTHTHTHVSTWHCSPARTGLELCVPRGSCLCRDVEMRSEASPTSRPRGEWSPLPPKGGREKLRSHAARAGLRSNKFYCTLRYCTIHSAKTILIAQA